MDRSSVKVYVIMGNDYPDAVFSTEKAAEAYVATKVLAEIARCFHNGRQIKPRIHWRVCEFEVRE